MRPWYLSRGAGTFLPSSFFVSAFSFLQPPWRVWFLRCCSWVTRQRPRGRSLATWPVLVAGTEAPSTIHASRSAPRTAKKEFLPPVPAPPTSDTSLTRGSPSTTTRISRITPFLPRFGHSGQRAPFSQLLPPCSQAFRPSCCCLTHEPAVPSVEVSADDATGWSLRRRRLPLQSTRNRLSPSSQQHPGFLEKRWFIENGQVFPQPVTSVSREV